VVDHAQLDRVPQLTPDHGDGAAVGVPHGVVQQVGEHLLEQDGVGQHRRDGLGHPHVDALAARRLAGGGADAPHHRAGDLGERGLLHARIERVRLDARHVEQVVDQAGEPVGLLVDGDQELVPLALVPGDLRVEQARRGRLDRGQRGSQVVRDGVEQGGAEPVDLLEGPGPGPLVLLPALLDGQGRLVGEGRQQAPFGLAEDGGAGAAGDHHQGADGLGAGSQRHGQRLPRLEPAADPGARGGGEDPLQPRRGLAVARGDPHAVAAVRQDDGATGQVEQGPDRAHHAGQGVVEAAVRDQAGGQLVEGAGLLLAPLRLDAPPLQRADQVAHHEGGEEVDGQREVVLPVADDQGVVGRQEEEVERQETGHRGDRARPEPARGGGHDHHGQEGEHHVGLGDVGAHGQQPERRGGRAEHGDQVAETGPRPVYVQPALVRSCLHIEVKDSHGRADPGAEAARLASTLYGVFAGAPLVVCAAFAPAADRGRRWQPHLAGVAGTWT